MFPELATHVRKRTSALKLQIMSTTSGVRPPTTIQDGAREISGTQCLTALSHSKWVPDHEGSTVGDGVG